MSCNSFEYSIEIWNVFWLPIDNMATRRSDRSPLIFFEDPSMFIKYNFWTKINNKPLSKYNDFRRRVPNLFANSQIFDMNRFKIVSLITKLLSSACNQTIPYLETYSIHMIVTTWRWDLKTPLTNNSLKVMHSMTGRHRSDEPFWNSPSQEPANDQKKQSII